MIDLKINIKGGLALFVLFGLMLSKQLHASDYQSVVIDDPFIEMHTGPGRGYPVFHVVEKGQSVLLLKKKTQWYKVEAPRGKIGWVHERQMARTLTPLGEQFQTEMPDQQGYVERNFEAGFMSGDFDGSTVLTLYSGWNWTPNIATELSVSQALGNVSDIQFAHLGFTHTAFPDWRVAPYVKIGAGVINTKPRATLVFPEDRQDEMLSIGIGARGYVSRQFFLRAEYNSYTILTSRNDNDQVEEWKIGFSVYF